jgi:hypothetical protein
MIIITLSGVIFLVILNFSVITNIYGQEDINNTTLKKTFYFEIEIPDDWIYRKFSNAYATGLLGFGPSNSLVAIPVEYWGSNTSYAVAQFNRCLFCTKMQILVYIKYKLKNKCNESYFRDKCNSG